MHHTRLARTLPATLLLPILLASLAFIVPAHAATTVVVSPAHMDGWAFLVTSTDGKGDLVNGPSTPPLGTGSAYLFTGTHGDESAQLRNSDYAGMMLSSLTLLSYWTYASQWNGQQIPYIILNIDFEGDGAVDDMLFFEPAYQTTASGNQNLPDQGAVALDTWQYWNAAIGGWWSLNGIADATPGTGVKPLSEYTAKQPTAKIVNADGLGGVRLLVGYASATDVFEANVDKFTIGFNGADETIYDFEATEPVTTVSIDIKPGSYPNPVNLKSKGVIPVAVLGSETFDVSTVDLMSLTFGPKAAAPVHHAFEDVNGDGIIDLILHFRTQTTGITAGMTEASLSGSLLDGTPIEGSDSIVTVPKK